ncbi:S8 family peptidase [Alkaliphilus hydrothermalis]|uniref:Subtilisin family serine protease n=1 Tax=Alkaliphilus hydrothermalis TaxID=1482730 RepID=A0ABS2NS96_9FIRM|nr:S8 family serine peptidase [Alkaliphilus hydrothermalis]MBM7615444.1 subtilisin family serine protease [Alkaliphilus hydrothermalis]
MKKHYILIIMGILAVGLTYIASTNVRKTETLFDIINARPVDVKNSRSKTIVSIIDSGVDIYNYNDRLLIKGRNIINTEEPPIDKLGHGTIITDIIFDVVNEVMIHNEHIKVLPVKVFDDYGNTKDKFIPEGIKWAVDNGANIINLSIAMKSVNNDIVEAIEYASQKDVLIVASVGNDGTQIEGTLLNNLPVIWVGSINKNRLKSNFSSFGEHLILVALGEDIETSKGITTGTSYSVAQVTAAAAILKSIDNTLTPMEIKNILQSSAKDLGAKGVDKYYGYGLLDIKNAIKNLEN